MSKKPMISLQVVSQPSENWYKDEGGKSNTLHCVVRTPVHVADTLHLRCTLYYESETIVEDKQSEILSLTNPRGLCVSPDASECEIEFRIEKVSRRKDGQRFKLYIEPDAAEVARLRVPLTGVFTNPINVMSKRKTGERIVSRKPAARPVVDLPDDGTATLKMLHATLLQMQRTLDEVAKSVKKVDRRVASVENAMLMAGSMPSDPPGLHLGPSSIGALGGLVGVREGSTSSSSAGAASLPGGSAAAAAAAARVRASHPPGLLSGISSSSDLGVPYASDAAAGAPGTRSQPSRVAAAKKGQSAGGAAAAAAAGAPFPAASSHAAPAFGSGPSAVSNISGGALQFATNIFDAGALTPGVSPAVRPAAAPEVPTNVPTLLPGLSHQISNIGPDLIGSLLPPSAALHGVKRIRSTDIAVDYALTTADAFAYALGDNVQSSTGASATQAPPTLDSAPVPLPLRAHGSLSRLLSRQTSEDMGAWFDHFLHSSDPPEKVLAEAAGTVKRAKLQVIETVTGNGEVSVSLFTDDPALAGSSASAAAASVMTATTSSSLPPAVGQASLKRRASEK